MSNRVFNISDVEKIYIRMVIEISKICDEYKTDEINAALAIVELGLDWLILNGFSPGAIEGWISAHMDNAKNRLKDKIVKLPEDEPGGEEPRELN